MRVAVLGHVEHITLGRVPRVPASGEIAHATDVRTFPGGGGGIAFFQLVKSPEMSKKVRLSVDSFAYWMATNTPKDNVERQRYFERYGVHNGLTHLARDFPVESRAS